MIATAVRRKAAVMVNCATPPMRPIPTRSGISGQVGMTASKGSVAAPTIVAKSVK